MYRSHTFDGCIAEIGLYKLQEFAVSYIVEYFFEVNRQ